MSTPHDELVGNPGATEPFRPSTDDELPQVPAIDVHTHLFPERLQAAVRRALADMYGWEFDIADQPQAFAAVAAAHRTEQFVILPYAHKPGIADSLNAWVAETGASLDGGIPFACVHPDDNIRQTLDAAAARGSRGVKLHHQVQEVAPDDTRLFPVYEWLIEHSLPLMAHAGRGPTDNGLVGPERVRPVLERYPDLRVCVPHLGMPDGDAFIALAREHPNLWLDVSGIGDQLPSAEALRPILVQTLYGTDAPNVPWGYGVAARTLRSLGFSPEEEARIFRTNAQSWLDK